MKTNLIAILYKTDGTKLEAPFSVFENHQQIIRVAADNTMEKAHGVRHANGWGFAPGHKIRDDAGKEIEPIPCPWYGLREAKALGIPLPKPEDFA